MKVINLNESQYQRLFELDSFVAGAGGNVDGTPQNLSQDETFITGVTKKQNGDESLVEPDGNKFVRANHFKGANVKQDQMTSQEWGSRTNRNKTNTV